MFVNLKSTSLYTNIQLDLLQIEMRPVGNQNLDRLQSRSDSKSQYSQTRLDFWRDANAWIMLILDTVIIGLDEELRRFLSENCEGLSLITTFWNFSAFCQLGLGNCVLISKFKRSFFLKCGLPPEVVSIYFSHER